MGDYTTNPALYVPPPGLHHQTRPLRSGARIPRKNSPFWAAADLVITSDLSGQIVESSSIPRWHMMIRPLEAGLDQTKIKLTCRFARKVAGEWLRPLCCSFPLPLVAITIHMPSLT
jgi:hypothetical protein